ncbi:hypothetical protein [Luteimonas mephitis]|uniref:hypothetical protein n=1 Tax=Luteimonas mephitis TaxID=83615 RepID=UPI003A90B78D
MPVENAVINDIKLSATPIACTPSTIPVGGNVARGPVTATITPADVANGSVDNSATAGSGTPPGGTEVTSSVDPTTPTGACAGTGPGRDRGHADDRQRQRHRRAGDTPTASVSNDGNVPNERDQRHRCRADRLHAVDHPVGGTAWPAAR